MAETKLNNLYYNAKNPGAYSGAHSFIKANKLKSKLTKNWLKKQLTYTLHFPVRKRFPRRVTFAPTFNWQWQIDLADFQKIAKFNNGNRYLLVAIDVFSKMVFTAPVKRKTAEEVTKAFKEILERAPNPKFVQSDWGTEFMNKKFRALLQERNIHFFTSSNSDIKCAVVERVIRTLKGRLWRYFSHKNTWRWVDIMPDIVYSYNRTFHRSIGVKPIDVNHKNEKKVFNKLYSRSELRQPILKEGDAVRVSKLSNIFRKGYENNWSEEIFYVNKVYSTQPKTYNIRDSNNEVLEGKFYIHELQLVFEPELWRIEKVLKRENERLYVKWLGYPKNFNSWISVNDIKV